MGSSDGHTLSFTNGGLDIDTSGVGKGLEALNSGTITVTGTGNTIDTTTGIALNLGSTDIGDDDLTFEHIASNGAVNGIAVANSANPNGRLFVTSAGSGTCQNGSTGGCTGGVIANSTQSGISLNTVAGGAELTRMGITGSSDHGVTASAVGGLKLRDLAVLDSGNASGENGLNWSNVTGVSSIQNTDVFRSRAYNAKIANTSGTLQLTVTGSRFNTTDPALSGTGEDGLQLLVDNVAQVFSNIDGNTFTQNKGEAFQVGSNAAAPSAVSHTTFTNNTIDGRAGTATDGGIVFGPDGSDVRAEISDNTITNPSVSAIVVNPNPVSTGGNAFSATVSNNIIGTDGVADSGSVDGDGIQLKSATDGTARVAITGNTIQNYDKNGLMLRASESSGGDTQLTATGNTIRQPDATHSETGIMLEAGSSAGDTLTMCADVGSNTYSGTLSAAAIGQFWLSLRFPNSTMRAPGYTGTTFADRSAYFRGRNTGFTDYVEDGTQNMSNTSPAGSACLQPVAPTLPTAP
jgi:hypothetical protein